MIISTEDLLELLIGWLCWWPFFSANW